MTTQQDASVGIKKEASFGTAVTPDHFPEFTSEDFDWNPTFTKTAGMRVGRVVGAADRRVLTKVEPSGSLELEAYTKGMGILFEAALGSGTSTLITGTSYQQLFTPTTTDYLPSYTVQVGVPPLGGGAASAQTYDGMVCSGFELTAGNTAIPSLKFNFVGQSVTTATAYTSPSYPATMEPFSFVGGSIRVGGSVTVPTTTALATGGTSAGNVQEVQFTWSNELDGNGWNLGSSGERTRKPALGERAGSGTLTVEYDSDILRDAYKNQTDLALVLTFATTTAISGANFPTLQFTIPNIRLDGEMPKPNGGDVITQTIPFTVLDNRVAASALYVAIVTAETAI